MKPIFVRHVYSFVLKTPKSAFCLIYKWKLCTVHTTNYLLIKKDIKYIKNYIKKYILTYVRFSENFSRLLNAR